jgi:hypothetical protein
VGDTNPDKEYGESYDGNFLKQASRRRHHRRVTDKSAIAELKLTERLYVMAPSSVFTDETLWTVPIQKKS